MTKNPGPTARDIEVAGTLRTGIHRLVKLVRRETRNEAQLSLTERSAMGSLYPDRSLEPTHIARAENVTTQSMSQIINKLYKNGFIDKTASEEDKRKVLLSLTPAGRIYIEQLRQDKQEWLAKVLHERTTAEEKDLLMRALEVLSKLTEE
jgi:DNA-binding MarR family transcriptional regulator